MICRLSFLVLTAVVMACEGSPDAVSRRYELVSVDGKMLPALLDSAQLEPSRWCWERVLTGSYVLDSDTTWRDEQRREVGCADEVDSIDTRGSGPYLSRGDTLRFQTAPESFVMWRGRVNGDSPVISRADMFADLEGPDRTYIYVLSGRRE